MPRTTRAQSMDALSSMGTICGYKAVIIAADTLPRIFPMLTTAAGTITPVVSLLLARAWRDCRPLRRLGGWARWLQRTICGRRRKSRCKAWAGASWNCPSKPKTLRMHVATERRRTKIFIARQRELLSKVVAESDVVITAAVVPGQKSPRTDYRRHGEGDGARFGDRRSGFGARRELRIDQAGRKNHGTRRDHHRVVQLRQLRFRTMRAKCTRRIFRLFCCIS